MGKENFSIRIIDKNQAARVLLKYHYLKDISRGFKSGVNYGLFEFNNLVGTIIFTGFPVPELCEGMLGIPRNCQDGLFELSRLCLTPDVQAKEHNIASWFVSKAIKQLRKDHKTRCILSYADNSFHSGIVYAACNFGYYGLTTPKKDFWVKLPNGNFQKMSRGKTKGVEGEWRDRTQKHRFVILTDNSLSIKWKKIKWVNPNKYKEGK